MKKYLISFLILSLVAIAPIDDHKILSNKSSGTLKAQALNKKLLKIPSYRQQRRYSCMAAAARSALAYRGKKVSEKRLLNLMGYQKTKWRGKWRNPNAVWGDPDVGIVGNLSGTGGPGRGYGAHWNPTSRAISKFRKNEIKRNWTVQGIAAEIDKGNPVIVWWVNGVWPAYKLRWKTKKGKTVRAVNSMHVQVVKGFRGTVENPTSFIVTDSGYGYPSKSYSTKRFKSKWRWFYNTAIVVY